MLTTFIRSLYNIKPQPAGGVMTIGNFYGIHVGHQQLIKKVVEKARILNVPSIAITFEPHPFEFFLGKDCHIPRITRLREKCYAFSENGLNHVIILTFNQHAASIIASDFVKMLCDIWHPRHIFVGDDFHFGHQREGNFQLLKKMGEELGFAADSIETVVVDGERVSSTRVRSALADAKLDLVKRLLGHPYCMLGRIREGNKLGRQLGFPTANIALHRRLTPLMGIYIVYVHGIANLPWPGVASIGIRPTIGGASVLLEVHLLDFHRDIYGLNVRVEFCKKLRDEICFPTIDLLREKISQDIAMARKYFLKHDHGAI